MTALGMTALGSLNSTAVASTHRVFPDPVGTNRSRLAKARPGAESSAIHLVDPRQLPNRPVLSYHSSLHVAFETFDF